MNYLLDSNILLYAKMDAMPEHAIVSRWLEDAVTDPHNTISICETSILSFLRIATNSKVFDPILPDHEAASFIESLLNCPNVNMLRTSSAHYPEGIGLMERSGLHGNLVMNAHLAVLAQSIGATLVTRDRDFARPPYLKTLNPLKK